MDLSALGTTLPPGLADAERDMGDKFRASALSITNLYKSSLAYTKQAYQAGYSACLADVLSTVQSSIASGQDATQTLSRLMDWAEAREASDQASAAMQVFAAEDTDEIPSNNQNNSTSNPASTSGSLPLRRAAITKQALSHLPQRPSSAPIPTTQPHRSSSPPTLIDEIPNTSSPAGPMDPRDQSMITASTPIIETPQHSSTNNSMTHWQPTPDFASSPTAASSSISGSIPRPPTSLFSRKIHHSPIRNVSTVPQSTFNPNLPTLPTAGVPFTTNQSNSLPIGSKRTLVDFEMNEDHNMSSGTRDRSTPSRASKRRSLAKVEEGEDSQRDRRKGGRRGHGPGGPPTTT